MAIREHIEHALGRLLKNRKAGENKLFIRGAAFSPFPNPTIQLTSDCGPSGCNFDQRYSQFGDSTGSTVPVCMFTSFSGSCGRLLRAPKSTFFYVRTQTHRIPPLAFMDYGTSLKCADIIEVADDAGGTKLKGSLKLGKNRRGTAYVGPRPLYGHGPHRYFWELVALREPVDETKLSAMATKDELAVEIVGKLAGWGQWIGVYETTEDDIRGVRPPQ